MITKVISITDYTGSLGEMPFTTRDVERERILATPTIIISAGPCVATLASRKLRTAHLILDKHEVALDFLKAMQQEKEAAVEIGYCSMSIAHDAYAENPYINANVLCHILNDFGTHLLNELRALGLFHNGYLNWRFDRLVGNDIVLRRRRHDLEVV